MYIYIYIYIYRHIYIHIQVNIYIYHDLHTYAYVYAYILKHGNIDVIQNNQLIHKHIPLTFYQSRYWMVSRHVDIIHVRLYLWICIWIYVPTCRNKCNWCTLKHLVLVRINGLRKSPKIPGNTFSNAYAARKKLRFAWFFLAEVTKKNDAHLQSFFDRNAPCNCTITWGHWRHWMLHRRFNL